MEGKCLLKIFGIRVVNEVVRYQDHPDPDLVFVYYFDDWHVVPRTDVRFGEWER